MPSKGEKLLSLAPFVATPQNVIDTMLQAAELKKDEILFDLGCGDGRIIIEAAQKFGAKAIGVEINEGRYKQCLRKIQETQLESMVKVVHGDLLDLDLTSADVVTLYLLTSANDKVKPNLERDLKTGARVVSHDFPISGWTPSKVININDTWSKHTIYIYRL